MTTHATGSPPSETLKIGRRGTLVIPARLRRLYGLDEGTSVKVEELEGEGILIRPVAVLEIELYTRQRRAEFLLSNAVDAADYARALEEVRRLGLDPNTVPHHKPPGA